MRDREPAKHVARHQRMFFFPKDAGGSRIGFEAAVGGGLVPVPDGEALNSLERDYNEEMVNRELIWNDPDKFENVMEIGSGIEKKANGDWQ